jgi:hypothetical protein
LPAGGITARFGLGQCGAAILAAGLAIARSVPARCAEASNAVDFTAKPVEISGYGLNLRMRFEPAADPNQCDGSAPMSPDIPKYTVGDSCQILMARLYVGGKQVAARILGDNAWDLQPEGPLATAQIVRLDAASPHPQVLLFNYTGGPHCCVGIWAMTDHSGGWRVADLGSADGTYFGRDVAPMRAGPIYVLVGRDEGFDGTSFGHANPTRIRRLDGLALKDVTRDPQYRHFLRSKLSEMEANWPGANDAARKEFLAAWVAEKALVGEFQRAWTRMLATYDQPCVHDACCGFYDGGCGKTIQPHAAFPEALAVHLVETRYITAAEAKSVGYDVPAILAHRAAAQTARSQPPAGR